MDAWVSPEGARAAVMSQAEALRTACLAAVVDVGLTVVGTAFHQFPAREGAQGGVTGTVLLAESHLAIHTWPERAFVSLDIYVCNQSANHGARADALLAHLQQVLAVERCELQRVRRVV